VFRDLYAGMSRRARYKKLAIKVCNFILLLRNDDVTNVTISRINKKEVRERKEAFIVMDVQVGQKIAIPRRHSFVTYAALGPRNVFESFQMAYNLCRRC
jgi:hypothetical protein